MKNTSLLSSKKYEWILWILRDANNEQQCTLLSRYRLGRPGNYLCVLSKIIFIGSRYPKKTFNLILKKASLTTRIDTSCAASSTCSARKLGTRDRYCRFQTLLSSPPKSFIFIMKKNIFMGSHYPKKKWFNFEKIFTARLVPIMSSAWDTVNSQQHKRAGPWHLLLNLSKVIWCYNKPLHKF